MNQDNSSLSHSAGPMPAVVPLKVALRLLGNKSRSVFYVEAAQGKFDVFKDGVKTLVSVASINRYIAKLPRAQIGRKQAGA
jgi:hypothetical protein